MTPETPLKAVRDFGIKIFEEKEMAKFTGDEQFVYNANACKTYSKLRSSIGGLYPCRPQQSASAHERQFMAKEADFAFRQALALCPYSPEAVQRYSRLLVEQGRKQDADLFAH